VIELANVKTPAEWDAKVQEFANIKPKLNTTSHTAASLEKQMSTSGSPKDELLAMVNESCKADTKKPYDWHWNKVIKSKDGAALYVQLKTPEKQVRQIRAKEILI